MANENIGEHPEGNALSRLAREMFRPERYRWWHALAFGVGANAISTLATGRNTYDREYYERMRQAPFAPPGWLFGPAWTLNNASVLWGNLRLLNQPEDVPNRRGLLWLQAASWLVYASFGYVYFRKRSPILAFVWTAADWALTVASVILSLKNDKKITLSLGTLLAWLTLATPAAAYQAASNPDDLFGTPALRRWSNLQRDRPPS